MATSKQKDDDSVLGKRTIAGNNSNIDEPPRKKQKTESAKLDSTKCSVWLTKKRRQCKHDLVSGTKYCRFHIPWNESTKNIERMECKYCKTLIFKKKGKQNNNANLNGHYKRCPVKLKMDKIKNQLFYDENIHFYGDYKQNEEEKEDKNSNKLDEKQLIEKLQKISSTLTLTKIMDESKNSSFDEIRDLYLKIHSKKENLKHCKQIESIILNMDKHCNLNKNDKNKPIILELGGGKASFGSMLHYFYGEESKLIIIDINSNFRHKEDNRLEKVNNVHRIECGLQHCNISKIEEINDKKRDILVISKHLCGCATDFGLRCIINDDNIKNENIKIIAIALCCRGKCSFKTYCNLSFFNKIDLGNQFESIRQMTSWEIDGNNNKNKEKHFQIGVICRKLIDEGRVQYLKKNGFKNVKLIKYVTTDITKENILLLASKN